MQEPDTSEEEMFALKQLVRCKLEPFGDRGECGCRLWGVHTWRERVTLTNRDDVSNPETGGCTEIQIR